MNKSLLTGNKPSSWQSIYCYTGVPCSGLSGRLLFSFLSFIFTSTLTLQLLGFYIEKYCYYSLIIHNMFVK